MIKKELIEIDAEFSDRDSCLRYMIEKADECGLLNDKEIYREAVEAREKQFSTALGFSVAIPHGKSEGVKDAFVSVLRTKEEFIWDQTNNNEVRLVFLIGMPMDKVGNLHLQCLAEISKNIINDDFRNGLLTAATKDEVYELLNEINEKVRES